MRVARVDHERAVRGEPKAERGLRRRAGRPLRCTCYGRNFAGKLAMMPLLSMSAMPSACW
jgi:hypothetical protein